MASVCAMAILQCMNFESLIQLVEKHMALIAIAIGRPNQI
jgi:hypothetical protein